MKLASLKISNFRAFDSAEISFNDYTSLVGANGTGKSTILTALNVLFRNVNNVSTDMQTLTDEDFHNKNTERPIEITAEFHDLSDEAQQALSHYFRQNRLIVKAKATWDSTQGCAIVKQYGVRLIMVAFKEFFQKYADGANAPDLNILYEQYRAEYPGLPTNATSKEKKYNALRSFEEAHPELCSLEDSEDQFFGIQGTSKLDKYIQWVYIPAVKDAASEQEETRKTALGKLLERTIRTKVNFTDSLSSIEDDMKKKYSELLRQKEAELRSVSDDLEKQLKIWSHPDANVALSWSYPSNAVKVSEPFARAEIGEKGFLGDVRRMGHGLQRSFIVSVLKVLASSNPETAPTLLLGFEEPELYQHPPQARHLARTLERMDNSQVIISTHSPYFISGSGVENVRLLRWREETRASSISFTTFNNINRRLADALGCQPVSPPSLVAVVQQIMQPSLNELYFCGLAIFVEGVEDIAYISTYLELSGRVDAFRQKGGQFIVCDGKTILSRPLAIAIELGIPCAVIYDADKTQKPEDVANINPAIK